MQDSSHLQKQFVSTINHSTDFWNRFRRNRAGVVGLFTTVGVVLLGLLAPLLSPYDPLRIVGTQLLPPSHQFVLGTDDLGRDVLSGIIWGARISLLVGVLTAFLSTCLGTLVGAMSGYFGNWLDDILMRASDVVMTIPTFFLAIVVLSLFGQSIWFTVLVIGLTFWPQTARVIRAEFLSLKNREFVIASKVMNAGQISIIFDEILPNAIQPAIVMGTLNMGAAILLEAGLSFMGLSDPMLPSWGKMLQRGYLFLRSAWWVGIFPGIALSVTVMAINLLGDGLNDALNPRLRVEFRGRHKWLKMFSMSKI